MIRFLNAAFDKYRHGDTANSLMLAFTQSLVALIFIFVDFIFSKRMDVASFGVWKQMYFILGLLVPILSLGVPEGFKYYIAKDGKKSRYYSNMIFMLLLTTSIGVGVFAILNMLDFFVLFDLKEYYLISLLFPLGFLFFNLNKALRYVNINDKEVLMNTKIVGLYFIPTILLVLLLGYYFKLISHWYLWIGLLIYLLVFGSPLISLLKHSKLKYRFSYVNTETIKKMLKIGLPLYLSTFIGMMIVNFDKGVVTLFENKAIFAIFSVGAMEIPIFAMLSAAFSQQTYPALVKLMASDRKDEAKNLWIKTTVKVSYITYPMILVLMIFAKPLLFFIYSDKYIDAVNIFQIYLLVGLLRNNYYGALITAGGNTKFITYYSLLTLVLNAIFSLSLYWIIGIDGIVYGTFISAIIIATLQLKHEGMLQQYFFGFLFNKKIIVLFILIAISFFIF